ncbi:MAG: sterol desaturase family protein [Chrysiogenales bacterium]|nr:MAG: sterol desaturase family protein [Chrysiogenales bacterium]
MEALILSHFQFSEATIRLTAFIIVLAIMMIWEIAAPRRTLTLPRRRRWFGNLGIILINTLIVRVLAFFLPVSMAIAARNREWGVMNQFDLPLWFGIIAGVVLLDLMIYLQHVMFHTIPLLWRLHLVHHADLDLDVTSGIRFHPVEILLSMLIKLAAVSVIGPPPLAVILFEVLLNATSMFNHGNVRMPIPLDRVLRYFVVTPDMHRVHHSVNIRETNSNFGFNLPWWDRLLGTYRDQPVAGHQGIVIGLAHYRDTWVLSLARMLILPLVAEIGVYAINRRGAEPKRKETTLDQAQFPGSE